MTKVAYSAFYLQTLEFSSVAYGFEVLFLFMYLFFIFFDLFFKYRLGPFG